MIFHRKIEKIYQGQVFVRFDETGLVKYFTPEDFCGLHATPYTVLSSLGHTLQGYFYAYDGADDSRLVVFEHGLGGGHRAYMREIEKLCAKGYRVFAYDHTGCMQSGGESANGLAQSLHDLDDCLRALKADAAIQTDDISVVGHSWGGYSAMNIAAYHPDVKRLVVLCGFVSVEKMIEQNFKGILKGYQKDIMALERAANPSYADSDGIETLKNAKAQVLLVYSANDGMVHADTHFLPLQKQLDGRENIRFLLVEGKGHNPNYTADAVRYLGELGAALAKATSLKTAEEKQAFRDSFDWQRMTEQDEEVWTHIYRALE